MYDQPERALDTMSARRFTLILALKEAGVTTFTYSQAKDLIPRSQLSTLNKDLDALESQGIISINLPRPLRHRGAKLRYAFHEDVAVSLFSELHRLMEDEGGR